MMASFSAFWSYEYSPYRCDDGREIPAFEVFDGIGDKVFNTNEDADSDLQEANARLAAAAPSLRLALSECLRLLADYEGDDGEEGRAYRNGLAALAEAGVPMNRTNVVDSSPDSLLACIAENGRQ